MSGWKGQLVFDTTDANTIADSDSMGAFVRAGTDGDLIGSQTINSEEWLNTASVLHDDSGAPINDANPLPVDLVSPISVDVDLDGIYNVGTNPTPDNAGSIYHTRAAAIGDAQQGERTTAGVVATIASANISDMNAMDVNSFGYAIDDSTGDAELLTSSNADGGLNVHISGSDPLTINDAALADTAVANAAETLDVANTAQDVVAAPLASRKYLFIKNFDNRRMYIGATGVSAADGFPLSPQEALMLRAGASVDIEYVSPKVNHEIRTLELS